MQEYMENSDFIPTNFCIDPHKIHRGSWLIKLHEKNGNINIIYLVDFSVKFYP